MEHALAQRNRSVSLTPGKSRAALRITHPNAAGIDIGAAAHFVAVPPDRDDEPVREFPSFTVDLNAIADWLQACRVDTVALAPRTVIVVCQQGQSRAAQRRGPLH
jgi:transposase